jgi:hypothetical protein
MASIVNTRRIEKELIARGLMPAHCRLIEVRIEPSAALVIRYEVFVQNDQLGAFADALKAAADEGAADDERNLRAREGEAAK